MAALAACVLLAACNEIATRAASSSRGACPPACNVVLISIDTLRADHLGFQGYGPDTSPQLDAFAAGATIFEQAISQSAWTTPAHTSMLTGLYPDEHGVVRYSNPGRLPADVDTLAERLAAAGYRTAGFNGGGYVSAAFGLGDGFERYTGRRHIGPNVDAAIEWINSVADEPFFVFLHGYDVHQPYGAAPEFDLFAARAASASAADIDVAGFCLERGDREYSEAELDIIRAQYDAGVRQADHEVGRFLATLDAEGLLEHSIVIVTSDHGDEFFEHGGCDHTKTLYRELVHVPLVIQVPGRPASRVAPPVPASVAVTPTVLDLLGLLAAGDALAERSLGDWIAPEASTRGAGVPRAGSELVASETARTRAGRPEILKRWRALRDARWTFIVSQTDGSERVELYDRSIDADELHDVASEHPARVAELRAALRGEPAGATPAATAVIPVAIDRETRAALAALGYVE